MHRLIGLLLLLGVAFVSGEKSVRPLQIPNTIVAYLQWSNANSKTVNETRQQRAIAEVSEYIRQHVQFPTSVSYVSSSAASKLLLEREGRINTQGKILIQLPSANLAASKDAATVDTMSRSPHNVDVGTFDLDDALTRMAPGLSDLSERILHLGSNIDGLGRRRLHNYNGKWMEPELKIYLANNIPFYAIGPPAAAQQKQQVRFGNGKITELVKGGGGGGATTRPRGNKKITTKNQDNVSGQVAPWNLARLITVMLPVPSTYTIPAALATGPLAHPRVYVVDSGMRLTHSEFSPNRASRLHDQFPDQPSMDGHGTFVASNVGGNTLGVNPNVELVDVRALDSTGTAAFSDIIESIWAILADCMERGGRNASTSIANFSLGGNGDPSSSTGLALGAALHDLYQYCDVMVFAAAGNSHSSACQTLPAALILPSQGRVLAIGATNSNDELADFSNFGSCVAMHGPGVGNRGAWNTGDTAQTTASGTSFSSPTAAGVASLHLQQYPADYHELASQLPVYIPFSDRIAHKMLHDAIGVVEGVPASTTIGLIHITSTALDPFGEMSPLSPTTPITSSDGSCLEVYLFAAMLIVLVTISTT